MRDDKDKLALLGVELAQKMQEITKDFRLGFGSFVDKTVSALIRNCEYAARETAFNRSVFDKTYFAIRLRMSYEFTYSLLCILRIFIFYGIEKVSSRRPDTQVVHNHDRKKSKKKVFLSMYKSKRIQRHPVRRHPPIRKIRM